jgi:hypothetical protein
MSHFAHGVLVRLAVACGVITASSVQGQDVDSLVRQAVLSESMSFESLGSDDRPLIEDPRQVTLTNIEVEGVRLRLWRVNISVSHVSPYLVAWDGRSLLRLGGFTAPDLIEASSAIPMASVDSTYIERLSTILVLLADPNGGQELIYPFAEDLPERQARLTSEWRSLYSGILPDRVVERASRGWNSRVTVLSRNPHSGYVPWYPITYSFEFDATGRLTGWQRERHERFIASPAPSSGF